MLDGLQLAAEAIGASEAHLYLHPGVSPEILRALASGQAAGLDWLGVTITEAPPRFLAGQESALVNRLGGGPAVPTFVPPRVSERGLGGAPTLVQNVETLAHLALIARYGPRWFRELGTAQEPGSMLTTVQTKENTQIIEAEIGTPLRTLVPRGSQAPRRSSSAASTAPGCPPPPSATLTLDNQALKAARRRARRRGHRRAARRPVRPGRGGPGRPLPGRRVGRPVRPVPQRAAQAWPVPWPNWPGAGPRQARARTLERWAGLVTGRGACGHPDGTVRFVRSALTVFAPEISLHARGQCSATNRAPFLPLPDGMPMTEDDWT